MASRSFEELRVYCLAEELGDVLWEIVKEWDNLARDTIGKQIVRCADSIGANIAEGFGRGTYQDNRRYVRIARGSLYEIRHWLRRAYQRNLFTEAQVHTLKILIENLGPQLNAYLKSIGPSPRNTQQPTATTNDQ